MALRSRQQQLHWFFFTCCVLCVWLVIILTRDRDPHSIIKHTNKEEKGQPSQPIEDHSPPPKQTQAPQTLADLKREAISALESCSCLSHHRSSWLGGMLTKTMVVPNILHIVRYGDTPVTFVEAVCIKSYMIHQNPDKLYLHTNLVDLTNYGPNWDTLYQDKTLQLDEKLRVFMSRDPGEMNILGKEAATPFTASLYWKFHVLSKYGGVFLDTNILLLQDINSLRHLDLSMILFANQTFSATAGTLLSATTSSNLVRDILELSKNATEETFVEEIEKTIKEDEVSAGKFWNKDPGSNSTGENGGMMSLRLDGQVLAMTEEEVQSSQDSVPKILWEIWNRSSTSNYTKDNMSF